jgi:hypothetical protein
VAADARIPAEFLPDTCARPHPPPFISDPIAAAGISLRRRRHFVGIERRLPHRPFPPAFILSQWIIFRSFFVKLTIAKRSHFHADTGLFRRKESNYAEHQFNPQRSIMISVEVIAQVHPSSPIHSTPGLSIHPIRHRRLGRMSTRAEGLCRS